MVKYLPKKLALLISAFAISGCVNSGQCSSFWDDPPGSDFRFLDLPSARNSDDVFNGRQIVEECYRMFPFEGDQYSIRYETAKLDNNGDIVLIYDVYGIEDRRIAVLFNGDGKIRRVFRFSAL